MMLRSLLRMAHEQGKHAFAIRLQAVGVSPFLLLPPLTLPNPHSRRVLAGGAA